MKKTNIHKLVFAAVLVALAVVGSLVSFPICASKCAPVQHRRTKKSKLSSGAQTVAMLSAHDLT